MKTFFVTVVEPRKRGGQHLTKGVVSANSQDEAIEIAKRYYPVDVKGWDPTARFNALEILPNRFFTV